MFRSKIKKLICLSIFACSFVASNFCYSSEKNKKFEIIDINNSNYKTESSYNLLYNILALKKEVFRSSKEVSQDLSDVIKMLKDQTRNCHVLGLHDSNVNNLKCGAIAEKFDDGNVLLRYIFTEKKSQRTGYGTKMMDYIKNMVKEGKSISLEPTREAVGFYEKCNFIKTHNKGIVFTIFEWKKNK